MNYDLEANIISLEIGKGKIYKAKEFGNFIVHLSKAGQPILIEILNASNLTRPYGHPLRAISAERGGAR
jgi:uncharacterized protein YuzE